MPWAVAAAAVAAGGGMYQADQAKSAGQTQAQGAKDATAQQLAMFNTVNNQQQPYRQAGQNALSQISTGFGNSPQQQARDPNAKLSPADIQALYQHYLGRGADPREVEWQQTNTPTAKAFEDFIQTPGTNEAFSARLAQGMPNPGYLYSYGDAAPTPGTSPAVQPSQAGGKPGDISSGQFSHQFNANDLGTNLDPSYNFRRDQTLGAATNLLNKSGSAISGNTLKGVMDYGNNLATTGYQQAFENYNTNQTNIYNRLASIAGLGQTAGSNSTTGASSFSSGAAGSMQNAATAAAGGQVGSANALAGGANNAASWYSLGQVMKPTGTAANNPSLGASLDT